jgi:hypothetical protein
VLNACLLKIIDSDEFFKKNIDADECEALCLVSVLNVLKVNDYDEPTQKKNIDSD